jgi:hypothetical protein
MQNGNMKIELGLDKLVLTVSPPNIAAYAGYDKNVISICKMGEEFVSALEAVGRYKIAVRIKVSHLPADAWPLLQMFPRFKGDALFRLEFNPNRLGPQGMQELAFAIDGNMPEGWALFLHKARISRLDVNLDAHGLPLNRVVLRTTYPRKTEIWAQNGELETVYLGNKEASAEFYRVYALGQSKIAPGYQAATRFETVDKNTRPLLSALHLYDSPFKKLVVRSIMAPRPVMWTERRWQMFLRFAADHGLIAALSYLEPDVKKQVYAALDAAPIAGLDLTDCWKQWPILLDKLGVQKPGFHGSFLAKPPTAQAA